MSVLRVVDELLDRGLVSNVDLDTGASDSSGDSLGLGAVQVGDDDMTSPGLMSCVRERLADTRPATGDDHDPVVQFHHGHARSALVETTISAVPTGLRGPGRIVFVTTSAINLRPVVAPPVEDPKPPQRQPPRRSSDPVVDVEPRFAAKCAGEVPGSVVVTHRSEALDGWFEASVNRRTGEDGGRPKVVERTQDVVLSAVRMEQRQISLVGRFAGAEAAKQIAVE